MSNGSKKCSKCGQVKSLDEFHRYTKAKDGLQPACKSCRSEAASAAYREESPARRARRNETTRLWREANPDSVKAIDKRYRDANPEKRRARWNVWAAQNQEWLREYGRIRRLTYKPDPEARRNVNRAWRRRNKSAVREQTRSWRARNRQRAREQVQRRRAIKSSATTFVLAQKDLARLTGSECIACGAVADSVDHLIPLSRGGSHGVGNLAPMCRTCNSSKSAKTIAEWRKANGWLPLGGFPQRKE